VGRYPRRRSRIYDVMMPFRIYDVMMPFRPPGAQFLRPDGPGCRRLIVTLLSFSVILRWDQSADRAPSRRSFRNRTMYRWESDMDSHPRP